MNKNNINNNLEKEQESIFKDLESLNFELKNLNKELKKTKNKTQKKEIIEKINVLKKEINSTIKAQSKIKKTSNKKKNKPIEVVSFQMEKKEFKSSLIKMMRPYSTTKKRIIFPLIICLGLVSAIATLFFVQNTGLFSMGVTGILQGIAKISQSSLINKNPSAAETVYNILFWLLYFVFNIPLFIFAYLKISKKFALLTIMYVCATQIFGLCLSFIPGIHDIKIFGATSTNSVNIIKWSQPDQIIPLFFYASLQGMTLGFFYSILYMVGSSTGGTDIITFYYAKVKNMSISKLLVIFNSICIVLSSILGTIVPLFIRGNYQDFFSSNISQNLQSIFSPNLMFSIIIAIITSLLVGILFPKNKVIQINIYSQKIQEIKEKLLDTGYQHFLTINNTIGGYSLTAEQNIETICLYFQLPEIVSTIRIVDPEALIVTQKISDIDGKIMVVTR